MAWRAARADDAREVQTGAKQQCSCRNGSLRRAKARQVRSKTISLSSVFRSEVLEVKSHNIIVYVSYFVYLCSDGGCPFASCVCAGAGGAVRPWCSR